MNVCLDYSFHYSGQGFISGRQNLHPCNCAGSWHESQIYVMADQLARRYPTGLLSLANIIMDTRSPGHSH